MLFSIITVCYNSEKTIERTLKSVLLQECQDYEYIIVDGASTDKTLSIIKQYKPLFQGKLKLVSEVDKGIYDAMNKGINLAQGELIGIVNSDDYYEEDTLKNVEMSYQQYDFSVIYGFLRVVKNNKEVMVYLKNIDFLESDMIAHPSCFISKKIYERFGLYSLKYPYSADYEFMLRISKKKEIKFQEIYCILSNFSMEGASSSIKGYRDTLKLKHDYKLISGTEYRVKTLKSWINMKLRSIPVIQK